MNDFAFLSHFKLGKFLFALRALDNLNLPDYKGSTIRGAFGHAFKKVVCINRDKECSSCLLKSKCAYSYVFETPPPAESLKMKKYPFAPHPFVITPPLEKKKKYIKNDDLTFELTLIGNSIDYLPYFVYTFDELGKNGIGKGRGKFELREVTDWDGAMFKTIYSSESKTFLRDPDRIDMMKFLFSTIPEEIETINLRLITPMRLKFNEALSPNLEFHILLRNLLRRISLLSYFHCGKELDLDFRGLITRAEAVEVKKSNLVWDDWERYSNRQKTRMKMGGLIGSVVFEGNLEEFIPFLLLGEYVHVGKGTSFGLGKYRIVRT